jgi:hypothetical protein
MKIAISGVFSPVLGACARKPAQQYEDNSIARVKNSIAQAGVDKKINCNRQREKTQLQQAGVKTAQLPLPRRA